MTWSNIIGWLSVFDRHQVAGVVIILLLVMVYMTLNKNIEKNNEDELAIMDEKLKRTLAKEEKKSLLVRFGLAGVVLTLLVLNASYFFTAISVVSAGVAIAMREEIADFFVGFLVRTKLVPLSIEVGSVIGLEDDTKNQSLTVVKINGFKTILLNKATNEFISLRNTYLFRNKVKHIVVDEIYNIDCTSIVDVETNLYELEKLLIEKMECLLSGGDTIASDSATLVDIKLGFGAFPKLRSGFNIGYEQNAIGEIKVRVSFNVASEGRTRADLSRRFFKEIMAITQNYARKKSSTKSDDVKVEPVKDSEV